MQSSKINYEPAKPAAKKSWWWVLVLLICLSPILLFAVLTFWVFSKM